MINFAETQRVKDELDARPELYQEIIESSPLGICITNKDGMFITVNEAYCKIYQYDREELVGKHFTVVVPEEKMRELSTLHDRFIRTGAELLRRWEVLNKHGERIKIFVDTHFSDRIENQPCKVTFVSPM